MSIIMSPESRRTYTISLGSLPAFDSIPLSAMSEDHKQFNEVYNKFLGSYYQLSPPPVQREEATQSAEADIPKCHAEVNAMKSKIKAFFDELEGESRQEVMEQLTAAVKEAASSPPQKDPGPVKDPGNAISKSLEPFLVRHSSGTGFALPCEVSRCHARIFSKRWSVLRTEDTNFRCYEMEPAELLKTLNSIFETSFGLTRALETILTGFIENGCDLGHVYGHLRPCWRNIRSDYEFMLLQTTMQDIKERDYKMRASAITGNRINSAFVPPRRVWDLFANRVLPFYVTKYNNDARTRADEDIPVNVWSVSHSWRPSSERHNVSTRINSKAWSVPIPHDVTLDNIREELLSLGAEYVFLDVLCIRQFDKSIPEAEAIRKKEWRLDIPTIGYVYQPGKVKRPVVVYLTGLGRPFKEDTTGNVDDPFCWKNRVWTLQEHAEHVIPGGLRGVMGDAWSGFNRSRDTGSSSASPMDVLSRHPRQVLAEHGLAKLCEMVRRRAYSNPVDQVASLAYFLLPGSSLPIYDADAKADVAWAMVVENLPDSWRTNLLFTEFGARNEPSATWRPSWKEFLNCVKFKDLQVKPDDPVGLKFLDGSSPSLSYGRTGFDAYHHTPYVVKRGRVLATDPQGDEEAGRTVEVPLKGGGTGSFEICEWGPSVCLDVEYVLISFGDLKNWVVCKYKNIRRINTETALVVAKVSTLTATSVDPGLYRRIDGKYRPVLYY